jgi:hypothetical protein
MGAKEQQSAIGGLTWLSGVGQLRMRVALTTGKGRLRQSPHRRRTRLSQAPATAAAQIDKTRLTRPRAAVNEAFAPRSLGSKCTQNSYPSGFPHPNEQRKEWGNAKNSPKPVIIANKHRYRAAIEMPARGTSEELAAQDTGIMDRSTPRNQRVSFSYTLRGANVPEGLLMNNGLRGMQR